MNSEDVINKISMMVSGLPDHSITMNQVTSMVWNTSPLELSKQLFNAMLVLQSIKKLVPPIDSSCNPTPSDTLEQFENIIKFPGPKS